MSDHSFTFVPAQTGKSNVAKAMSAVDFVGAAFQFWTMVAFLPFIFASMGRKPVHASTWKNARMSDIGHVNTAVD